jgi:hypothetical protein
MGKHTSLRAVSPRGFRGQFDPSLDGKVENNDPVWGQERAYEVFERLVSGFVKMGIRNHWLTHIEVSIALRVKGDDEALAESLICTFSADLGPGFNRSDVVFPLAYAESLQG